MNVYIHFEWVRDKLYLYFIFDDELYRSAVAMAQLYGRQIDKHQPTQQRYCVSGMGTKTLF